VRPLTYTGSGALRSMDVTREYRVWGDLHCVLLHCADLQVVFFRDHDGAERVRLAMADGRAFTRFSLGEFLDLFHAITKELRHRHQESGESIEEALAAVDRASTAPRD